MMSGWKTLPSVSLIVAPGMFSRIARVRSGTPVRSMSLWPSTLVAAGIWSRSMPEPSSGVLPTTFTSDSGIASTEAGAWPAAARAIFSGLVSSK